MTQLTHPLLSRRGFHIAVSGIGGLAMGLISISLGGDAFPISSDSMVRRISRTDGLLPGEISVIHQDRRGFMWFGAETGLSRYDGFEFINHVHLPADPHSITPGPVWCIAEDEKANLWIGTQNGLNYYDRELETFERFTLATKTNEFHSNSIKSIHPNEDGTLWIGTLGESLHLFDPNTKVFDPLNFETAKIGSERWYDNITIVRSDRHERLWIGTAGAGVLVKLGGGQFIPIQQKSGNAEDQRKINQAHVNDFLFNEDGSVLVATEEGFFQIRILNHLGLSFEPNPSFRDIFEELKETHLHSLLRDSSGNLWFGTDKQGALTLSPSTGQYQQLTKGSNSASLASDVIRDIYEDQSGDLWFTHYPSGVSHINRSDASFTAMKQSSVPGTGLTHSSVTGFEEDDEGNLWITTDGGGINYWDRNQNTFAAYTPNDSSHFSASGALSVELDQQRSLWVGTWGGGLNRLAPGEASFKTYLPDPANPNSLSSPHVFCVLEDSYGSLWAATLDGGLNRYRPEIDGFTHYYADVNDPTSIGGNLVWVLYEDRDKRLWVGTNSGFNLYDRTHDHFVSYTIPESDTLQPINWVSTFLQDFRSHLWVGTMGGGLHEFVPGKGFIRHLSVKNGLSGNRICGLLEDESKNLWISTFDGLTHLNTQTGKFTIYHESNGLPGRQFNRFTAHKRLRSDELLFGTTEGMLIIKPGQLDSVEAPPPVVLTRLRLNNQIVTPASPESPLEKSISETDRLELDWGFSLIEIQFAALSYRGSAQNSFEFYLEGVDQDWRKSGKNQSASYANLAPGHYKFMVRAANHQGVWNREGKSITLIVHSPFWMEWWFRGMVVLLFMGGILAVGWTIARTRMQKLVLKAEHERNLLNERAEMRETLRQHQKMEAIGTLASGISHDFNNLLAGMVLNVENLKEDEREPKSKPEINELEQLIDRAQGLVRQILTFSRNEDIPKSPVDVVAVIRNGVSLIRATIPQSIEISERFPEETLVVMASETQLHQIILNLGSNAAQAMKNEKGRIHIIAERSTAPQDPMIPEGRRGQPTVRLQFEDNGAGMAPKTVERIFDPFFTTKAREKGTGLGLAVVFGIVKSHDGHMTVSSTEGKGTVFTIHFPLELDQTLPTVSKPPRELAPPEKPIRLMVVDDEALILKTLGRAFKKRGYEVSSFSRSREALQAFKAHPSDYDVILSDYTMPDLNGLEMIEQMKRIRPDIKAVMMSGASDKLEPNATDDDQPDAWLSKPFKIKALTNALSKLTHHPET